MTTERAAAVWSRFQIDFPGYRGGTYQDRVEGPLWVIREGKTVHVSAPEWSGQVRVRDTPGQSELGL